jgi:hypothetical protein
VGDGVSAAALDQVSPDVFAVGKARRGRAASMTRRLTEQPAVDLRVCGDGDGDGDGDDDGGRAHAPSEMRSTAHAGTTRLTGMKQQQLGRGNRLMQGRQIANCSH